MVHTLLCRSRLALAGFALLAGCLAGNAANAVVITITGASFTPGSGYGTDASETSSPTLLDVVFTPSVSLPFSFSLNSVGDSNTFAFGTINLQEPNAGGGIAPAETDNLDVGANFNFSNPLGTIKTVSATGIATTGSVSDSAVDYVIDWGSVLVDFGIGGQFEISLLDLSFTGAGSLTQMARIELLALPQTAVTAVPEPATLALFGLGLAGLAFFARRRRQAVAQAGDG